MGNAADNIPQQLVINMKIKTEMPPAELEENIIKIARIIGEVEVKYGAAEAFAFYFTHLELLIRKANQQPTFPREEEMIIKSVMMALEANGYTSIITRDRDQKRMEPDQPFTEGIYPTEEILNKFADQLYNNQEVLDILGLDTEEVLEESRDIIAAGNLIINANNRLADAGKHPEPSIIGFQKGISKIIEGGLENPASYPSARNILMFCLNDLKSLKKKYVTEEYGDEIYGEKEKEL
jgi:hypothetical protein